MSQQLTRVNDDPAHLKAENERLQRELEHARSEIKRLQHMVIGSHEAIIEPVAQGGWEQLGFRHYRQNGREAGTQVELARRLNVQSYDICKWVKQGRLKTVTTPDDKQSVWLDQSKPGRQKRQKK